MKKIIILAFVLSLIVICFPSAVFAKKEATVQKVEFVGVMLDAVEGQQTMYASECYGVLGNKVVFTYSDGSKKEYICALYKPEDPNYGREFFLNGDPTKEFCHVSSEFNTETFVLGNNKMRLRCRLGNNEGINEYYTDYLTIKATPKVVDLKLVMADGSKPLYTLVGVQYLLGSSFNQEGTQVIATYSDGSQRTFRYTLYNKYDADLGKQVETSGFFENGVATQKVDGSYDDFFFMEEIPNEGLAAGVQQIRILTVCNEEYVYSSETYPVHVYKDMDEITDDDPGKDVPIVTAKAANPLKVKGKTVKLKAKTLQKKAQTIKRAKAIAFTKKGQGKLSYKLASVSKAKFKKYFKVNAKTGNITVKKGLKKGTYKVKVKVKAAGTANYKASAWKTVTVTVKVK